MIKRIVPLFLLFSGFLFVLSSCSNNPDDLGVLGGCPMNTYSSVRGEMVVLDDLDLPEITLWRTHQADYY